MAALSDHSGRAGHLAAHAPPAPLWLVITVLGTLLAVAVLTTIPARIGARRSAAEILQTETA